MAEQRLIDANAILYCEAVDGDTFEGTGKFYARKKDIDALPTIEERKTGKWVGVKEYCDHLNEEAEREGKGSRYRPSGMNIRVYCNQCWEPNNIRTPYCPLCGCEMEERP